MQVSAELGDDAVEKVGDRPDIAVERAAFTFAAWASSLTVSWVVPFSTNSRIAASLIR